MNKPTYPQMQKEINLAKLAQDALDAQAKLEDSIAEVKSVFDIQSVQDKVDALDSDVTEVQKAVFEEIDSLKSSIPDQIDNAIKDKIDEISVSVGKSTINTIKKEITPVKTLSIDTASRVDLLEESIANMDSTADKQEIAKVEEVLTAKLLSTQETLQKEVQSEIANLEKKIKDLVSKVEFIKQHAGGAIGSYANLEIRSAGTKVGATYALNFVNGTIAYNSTTQAIDVTAPSGGSANIYSELLASVDLVQSGDNVTYSAANLSNVPLDTVLMVSRNGIVMVLGDTDNGYTTSGTGASTTFTFYNCTTSDKFQIIYTY